MPILNYTSQISVEKTTAEIIKILSKHGANAVLLNNDDKGQVAAISFRISEFSFRLPADWQATLRVLRDTAPPKYANEAQARRTSWRTVKDWVEAQCAFLETEQAKIEQLFLAHMVAKDGRTLYEMLASKGFLLLREGEG